MSHFTPEQQEAISDRSKILIVGAGAGTGKTTLILGRAIDLAKDPQNRILITTFTISARNELLERIKKLPDVVEKPQILDSIVIKTSGALAWQIAKHSVPDLTHVSESKARSILRKLLNDNGMAFVPQTFVAGDAAKVNDENEHAYLNYFVKGIMLLTVNDVQVNDPNIPEDFQTIYRAWHEYCADHKTYDHTGILALALKAVRHNNVPPALCGFTDILGDEAQDFSLCQYELMKGLLTPEGRLCLVGDSEQTIYSWRGAVPGLLGRYYPHGPDTRIIALTQNFRSTKQILEPSVRLVNTIPGVRKKLVSQSTGNPVTIRALANIKKEALYAAEKALALKDAGILDLSEFAVLARSHHALNDVFTIFTKLDIPFVYVGNGFFRRPEYQMVRHICDFMAKRDARNALLSLGSLALDKKLDIPQTCIEPMDMVSHIQATKQIKGLRAKQFLEALTHGLHLLDTDISFPALLNRLIVQFRIFDICSKIKGNRFTAHTLSDLRDMAQNYEDITAFCIGLDEREDTNEGQKPIPGSVFVGTPFAAKGKEFNTVFVMGMNDGIFPIPQPEESMVDYRYDVMRAGGMDEEARILFVAMTRAKRNLTLTYSKKSMGMGDKKRDLYPSSLLYLTGLKMPL